MSATLNPFPTVAGGHAAPADSGPRTADLGTYHDQDGRRRALIARPGVGGSVLVIDQDAHTPTDRRLVAHLAAEEPAVNAAVVAELYVADERRAARALEDVDWVTLPGGREPTPEPEPPAPGELRDECGRRYRVATVDDHRHGRQARWLRRTGRRAPEPVTLRTVVGALEACEPARALTRAALNHAIDRREVYVLGRELDQLERSPLILNRALRETAQRLVRGGELTLSCIAARCGRGKCSATGLRIGDTTWLQRRLGVLPEHGSSEPTPWIHTDVLALIAREGLGVEPREVELA